MWTIPERPPLYKIVKLLSLSIRVTDSSPGTVSTLFTLQHAHQQAPDSTVGQPCGSLSVGNIRRIFGGTFEILRAEWYTSVDSRLRLSTVELKLKAFLAVDSGA
eukprot:3658741-Pyramimonas_sp.AAC.2